MLNETQRNALESQTSFDFESIMECQEKKYVIAALEALTNEEQYKTHQEKFNELGMLDGVNNLRRIYEHPCPQNRTTKSLHDPSHAIWKDESGQEHREPVGL